MYYDELPIWVFIRIVHPEGKYNVDEYKYFIYTHLHFENLFNGSHVIEVHVRNEESSVTELSMDKTVVDFSSTVTW
jgi:hypothetical protein